MRLNCVNCGAPYLVGATHCSYCLSAIGQMVMQTSAAPPVGQVDINKTPGAERGALLISTSMSTLEPFPEMYRTETLPAVSLQTTSIIGPLISHVAMSRY